MLIVLIIFMLLFSGVGIHQWGTPYGFGGVGLGTILAIVLIVMLLRGSL